MFNKLDPAPPIFLLNIHPLIHPLFIYSFIKILLFIIIITILIHLIDTGTTCRIC